MNHFGRMADDLTSLEMSIDKLLDLPHAKPLKAALQRAFVEACKASRVQRLMTEAAKADADAGSSSTSRVKDPRGKGAAAGRFGAQISEIQTNNAAH